MTRGAGFSARPGWRRHPALAVTLVLTVLVAAGCQVRTRVDVRANADGSGTVAVVVTLDRAATRAVGDIRGQLQTSDLVRAGWTVRGPAAGPDGSTVLEATHPFATLAQASTLVAGIAGTGPPSRRPFRLDISTHRTFWGTTTRLVGGVDLSCDLACFGDAGLARQLGYPTGADPGRVPAQQRRFHFGVSVRLPGRVEADNAASRTGSELDWTPSLGHRTVLTATTSYPDRNHVLEAIVAAAALAVVLLAGLVLGVIRWRRRRRPRGRHHARHPLSLG